MSKINPKNLSYDSTLPPFLARLQANATHDSRHEFQAARPKKIRNAEEEAEDEPVYFDEGTGETLTKSEWEKRDEEEGKDELETSGDKEALDGEREEMTKMEKEKIAAIGGTKKRKVGKVVGVDVGDERVDKDIESKKEQKTGRKKVESGKGAKKGKKIKLSFGDDE